MLIPGTVEVHLALEPVSLLKSTETRSLLNDLHERLVARVHGLRPTSPIAKAFR